MNVDGDSGYRQTFDDGLGGEGPEGLQLPPWERRDRYGLLNALYLTTKDVLLAPQRFFHRMPSQVGMVQPLLYAVAIGLIGSFFAWVWSLAGSSLQVLLAKDMEGAISGPLWYFGNFIFSPVVVPILAAVHALLIHGVLMLVGGNRLGFEATFRVVAYGEAAGIISVIPFCGQAIAPLWGIAVTIIGLYSVHEISPWRAVLAVLAPMLVCISVVGYTAMVLLLGLS